MFQFDTNHMIFNFHEIHLFLHVTKGLPKLWLWDQIGDLFVSLKYWQATFSRCVLLNWHIYFPKNIYDWFESLFRFLSADLFGMAIFRFSNGSPTNTNLIRLVSTFHEIGTNLMKICSIRFTKIPQRTNDMIIETNFMRFFSHKIGDDIATYWMSLGVFAAH